MKPKEKYSAFREEYTNGEWCVVTVRDGLIIARVPHWINYPKGVAKALAEALNKSNFVLVDLI